MGCSSSKRARIVHRRSEPPSLHRSRSAPERAARRQTGGAATAVTTLMIEHGHLHLKEPTTDQAMEEEELRRETPENRRRSDLSLEVFPAKTWSAMVGRKLAGVPRWPTAPAAFLTRPAAEEKVAPEIVNAWELMEGLEDSSSSSSSGDTTSDRGTSPGSWAMERSMVRAASQEYKSLPDVGSLRHSPGSSRLSDPPPPENERASPEKRTMVEEKIWEDAGIEMDSHVHFPEQPIWDLVEQGDDSLLSEFDGIISDFRKSLESFSEIEECMKIEQFTSENPIHEMASITPPKDDANLNGV